MHMKRVVFIGVLALAFSFREAGYEVGDLVTDFKLKNVDGKMVSLADYAQARGFIVVFDCNTCPFSKGYNDRIVALHKKYAERGFPVIAIQFFPCSGGFCVACAINIVPTKRILTLRKIFFIKQLFEYILIVLGFHDS